VAKKSKESEKWRDAAFNDLFAPVDSQKHYVWWWMFIAPGKILLWLEYMFPEGITRAIGSARRKRSPIVQVWYSISFYIVFVLFIVILAAWIASR
jgi:hypothetical protein